MRKLKNYTNRSAGLAVDNPPAVGLALVKATVGQPLGSNAETVENMMFIQSPVLSNQLYMGLLTEIRA